MVFYYRGDFRGLTNLLLKHEKQAELQDDRRKTGMFYAWLGMALAFRMRISKSYQYLKKALKMGEEIEDSQIIGYASAWLTWTCLYRGDIDEAIYHGEKAQEISRLMPEDHYVYVKSLAGLGCAFFFQGDTKKTYEAGKKVFEYSRKRSNTRGMVLGHWLTGYYYILKGDCSSAIEYGKKAARIAADPGYYHVANDFLVYAYFYQGNVKEAEAVLNELIPFCYEYDCNFSSYVIFPGLIQIVNGDLHLGYKTLKEAQCVCLENEAKFFSAMIENILGRVFLNIVESSTPDDFAAMAKDLNFPIKEIPNVVKKAEAHFIKSIEISKEIGANFILAEAYFSLGLLHKAEKETVEARQNISKAIHIFEQIDADGYFKQAKEVLASLE
jgi:tetratricopeptide (TPR) repeat protein